MKPITPAEVRNSYHHNMRDDIIIGAYNELIHEYMDKPTKGEATFTQGQLVGRIHERGLNLPHAHAIAANYLRHDKIFAEAGWIVQAQVGFYDEFNSHLTITFKEKE